MAKDNTNDTYIMDEELKSPNFQTVDFYQKRKKGKYRLTFAPSTQYPVADTHCHLEMFNNPEWAIIRCGLHNVQFLACVIDSTDDGFAAFEKVELAYKKAEDMIEGVIKEIYKYGQQASEAITVKSGQFINDLCLDKNSVILSTRLPKIKYIVGTHPHHAKDFKDEQKQNLLQMLKHKDVACVGEIGLDYHYDLSPREDQRRAFRQQLEIAREVGLPVSLHLREAHDDALQIFDEIGFGDEGTILHCFNLGPEELKPWLGAGCYIALGGPLTFKKSEETRNATMLIPADRLLTETDAPFMTPEPLRGDICFPDHVIFTAEKLAEVTGNLDNKEKFYAQIYQNALDLLDR